MKAENIGWQCPNCLVVYSPSIIECWCSSLPKEPTVSLGGGSIVGVGGTGNVTTSKEYICDWFICKTTDGLCSICGKPKLSHYNISST